MATVAADPGGPQPRLSSGGAVGELAGLVQPFRLLLRSPSLLAAPRGRGQRVVVLPGRGFGDASTGPLRAFLGAKGYDVVGWTLGANRNDARAMVRPVIELLERRGDESGPVALVGQSLGGYLAREVARQRPDLVFQVITLGSPLFERTSSAELTVPVTALWSAADRVVAPRRASGGDGDVELIEVHSTHFSMGLDPDAWLTVARVLARSSPVGDGCATWGRAVTSTRKARN